MKKVVLGFSGGLDTSYCVKYLGEEKGYEVHSIIVNTGGFSEDELKKIAGIKGKTESVLNKVGIIAFSQLAKLTAADIPAMTKATGLDDIKEDWFRQAKKLVKNT